MNRCTIALLGLLLLTSSGAAESPALVLPVAGDRVLVRSGGQLARRLLDLDVARARTRLAAAARARPGRPAVWHTRLFVVTSIDAAWTDAAGTPRRTRVALTPAQRAALRQVAAKLIEDVAIYSGGAVRMDAQLIELTDPVRRLDGRGDLVHPWTGAMDALLRPHLGPTPLDSILVFWPAGDLPHRNYWGLAGSFAYRGGGYGWVTILHDTIDVRQYAEVALHEWLHQVEGPRNQRMGYAGLPALHDGGRSSYTDRGPHPGWTVWYRDFMQVYMTPAMWARAPRARAAAARPRAGFEGGFVRDWLVAGPYPAPAFPGWDQRVIDETSVRPARGQAAGPRRWQVRRADGPVLDLDRLLQPNDAVFAYAHVYVHSPVARPALLWVGSDDAVRVVVNGRRVWQNDARRGAAPDQDRVPIQLAVGWNRVLLRVVETAGGWGLCARLSDPAGRALPDLRWSAARPTADVVATVRRPPAAELEARHHWTAVSGDPWRALPLLDRDRLAALTGDPGLQLRADDEATALISMHAREGHVDARLRASRDSLAWLRYRRRGRTRDLLLIRPDLLPTWLAGLDAHEDPARGIVGRVMAGRRPLIAVETRLAWDAERSPPSELHLLAAVDGPLRINLQPDRRVVVPGEPLTGRARLVNTGDRPLTLRRVRIAEQTLARELRLPPRATRTLRWGAAMPAGPSGVLPLRLVAERHGVPDLVDPALLERRPALAVALQARSGRPAHQALLSGHWRTLIVRLQSHLPRPLTVRLSLQLPPGWQAEPPAPVRLAGGGSLWLPLRVRAPEGGPDTASLTLRALAVDGPRPLAARASLALKRSPWLLCGPFSHADRRGFDAVYPPERGVDPTAALAGRGGRVRWFDWVPAGAVCQADVVDLRAVLGPEPWSVAYAAADLVSAQEHQARLRLGSDDTLTVWVDGVRRLARHVYRASAPGQESLTIRVGPRPSRVLLKVCQGQGGWAFHAGVTDAGGRPLAVTLRRPGR